MRFFACSLSCLLLLSCQRDYSRRSEYVFDSHCPDKLLPLKVDKQWYKMKALIYDNYISGILLIKKTEIQSLRFILLSESGVSLFNMEQTMDGKFVTHYAMDAMNKNRILRLIQDNLQFLGSFPEKTERVFQQNSEFFYQKKIDKRNLYLVTDDRCTHLIRLEAGSHRVKKMVGMVFFEKENTIDSIHIQHTQYKIEMSFSKMENEN